MFLLLRPSKHCQEASINQWCWQTQAHLSLYVCIVLKTLVLISNNLYITLRSISGTGKVGSVIKFHFLELPKVIKSRLKCINRVNINYSIRQTIPNINYSISERKLSKAAKLLGWLEEQSLTEVEKSWFYYTSHYWYYYLYYYHCCYALSQ